MESQADSARLDRLSRDKRGIVLYCGYRSGLGAGHVDPDVCGTIAKPLAHAASEAAVLAQAADKGIGVALLDQSWRNQLPVDDPRRTGSWQSVGHSLGRQVLHLDRSPLPESGLHSYATHCLQAEIDGQATVLLSPAHACADQSRVGRRNELQLAKAFVEEARTRRAQLPGPGRPRDERRAVYAHLFLEAGQVEYLIDWLVPEYVELDVDGYWLTLANCRGTAGQMVAITHFALELQEQSGRPVCVMGTSALYLALLSAGVAAACVGHHGMGVRFPPPALPAKGPDDDDFGFAVHIYHPAALGSLPIGERFRERREQAFRDHHCDCGHHDPERPPATRATTVAHNTACIMAGARSACLPDLGAAREELAARVADATIIRKRLGLRPLGPGWRAVARTAEMVGNRRQAA